MEGQRFWVIYGSFCKDSIVVSFVFLLLFFPLLLKNRLQRHLNKENVFCNNSLI